MVKKNLMKKKNVQFVMICLEEEYVLIVNIVFVLLVSMNGLKLIILVLIVGIYNDLFISNNIL